MKSRETYLAASAFAFTLLALACGGRADGPSSTEVPAPSATSVTPPGPAPSCDASATTRAAGIAVASDGLNGFPPYAVAGCTLAYVSSPGDLVARDLSTGTETVIAPKTERPRRPTVSADLIAWEADEQSQSVVRVRAAGAIKTITGSFVSAGEPRASGSAVAFTVWTTAESAGDTDVWLYEAKTGEARLVIGGPGQQRFADLSSLHVAATDFGEDPDGRFDNDGKDLSDIVVFERATGTTTTRRAPDKQAFPMLADNGVLAYLSWSGIHPEPKLTAYDVRSGGVLGDPAADRTIAHVKYAGPDYARPVAVGATIEWIANPDGRTVLYRAPADGSSPPVATKGLDDLRLYAPAGTSGFTVLAAHTGSSKLVPRLHAVPR